MISGLLSLLLAVAAGLLMNSATYQMFLSFLTKDELASTATTVFTPAIKIVHDLELRWAVVVIMALSAVVPLLWVTRRKAQYAASLKTGVNVWRWVHMGVISALMVETIALLSGVQDIMTLKLLAGLMVVTCLLGWLSEKHNAEKPGTGRGTYVLSLLTGSLPWVVIAATAVGTYLYGNVRSPWYVYALYGTTIVAFLGYCLNSKRRLNAGQDYVTTERNYARLSILAQVAFAAILIAGLYKG